MQPTKFDLVINCKTASAWLRRAAVAARPRRRRLLSEAPRAIKLLGGAAAGWPLAALARQRPASTATEIIGLEPSPKLLEMANKAARKLRSRYGSLKARRRPFRLRITMSMLS
jgi:hypothetical protein